MEFSGADLTPKGRNHLDILVPSKAMVPKVQSGISGVLRPFQGVHNVKIIFIALRHHLPLSLLVEFSKVDVTHDSTIASKTMKKINARKKLMQKKIHERNINFQ